MNESTARRLVVPAAESRDVLTEILFNGAQIAPIDPAKPRIIPICALLNPSPPSDGGAWRYRAATGSHAPQTAYCRNIISDNRNVAVPTLPRPPFSKLGVISFPAC